MVVGRFLRETFADKECKQCRFWEAAYKTEHEEKLMLLSHIGIKPSLVNTALVDVLAKGYDIMNEEVELPLRRGNTLSEMRRRAEAHYTAKKNEPAVVIAPGETLTEAEAVFQESLNRIKH